MTVGPSLGVRALLGLVLIALTAMLASASTAFAATFTVTNTANEGAGSLRRAIEEANGSTGNRIAFDIPGTGPFTIAPTSALPSINAENTTIDACTQPGADCSALPLTLKIRLDGQGFVLLKNGITIKGFSFTGAGAAVSLARVNEGGFRLEQKVTIADNYLGLAPDGSAAGKEPAFVFQTGLRSLAGGVNGLHILDNVIGSNKIGAGANSAVDLSSNGLGTLVPISGLQIEGNVVGLDPTGAQPRAERRWRDPRRGERQRAARRQHRRRQQRAGARPSWSHPGDAAQQPCARTGPAARRQHDRRQRKRRIAIGTDQNGISKEACSGAVQIFGNTMKGNGTAGTFAGIATIEVGDTQRPNIQVGGFGPAQPNTISGNTGAGVAIGAKRRGGADRSNSATVEERLGRVGRLGSRLVQVAGLGLLNAIDRFDVGRGTPFLSFVKPTIMGELKRYLRVVGGVTLGSEIVIMWCPESCPAVIGMGSFRRQPGGHGNSSAAPSGQ